MLTSEVKTTAHMDDLSDNYKLEQLHLLRAHRKAVCNKELHDNAKASRISRTGLACSEYIMQVHAEGGGVDIKTEATRFQEYKMRAANGKPAAYPYMCSQAHVFLRTQACRACGVGIYLPNTCGRCTISGTNIMPTNSSVAVFRIRNVPGT